MRLAFALLLVALCARGAAAQDTPRYELRLPETPTVPDFLLGDDVTTALESGIRAPFRGVLMSAETAARWTNRDTWYRQTLAAQLQLHQSLIDELVRFHARELEIATRSYEREIAGLRVDLRDQAERFAQQQNPRFLRTFGGGITLGSAFVVVIDVVLAVLFKKL